MVCPNCKIQMHQKDKVGGGEAEDNLYKTWEVKECPACKRLVKESYKAEVISLSQLKRLEESLDVIID